jgi:hypothetical protein
MSVIFRLERAETPTNEDARHCCGADPHELLPTKPLKLIAYLTIQKGKKAVVLGSSSQRLVRTAHGYCRKSSNGSIVVAARSHAVPLNIAPRLLAPPRQLRRKGRPRYSELDTRRGLRHLSR